MTLRICAALNSPLAIGENNKCRTLIYPSKAHRILRFLLPMVLFYTMTTQSGMLRHGDAANIVSNVRLRWLSDGEDGSRLNSLVWSACDQARALFCQDGAVTAEPDVECSVDREEYWFDVLSMDRGIIALRHQDLYLSAEPDGRISAHEGKCGVSEGFLISDAWFLEAKSVPSLPQASSESREVAKFIIDARVRAKVCRGSQAKKILIYGYPFWSHGRVYYDLCVRLHRLGYIVDVINWQQSHGEYIDELASFYDLFLTSPDGVHNLINNYGVPAARIILVLHHEMDTRILVQDRGIDVFEEFAGYGVVSDFLFCASMVQGIRREPQVIGLGINYNEFLLEVSPGLRTVGYASSMAVTSFGVEWKRGHLAQAAAEKAGLDFVVAGATERQQSLSTCPTSIVRLMQLSPVR